MDAFEKSFQRIKAILKEKQWPGVEISTSYSTPSLKVKGKMLVRVREPGVLVLMCNLEAKEMLMMVAPHIYFELPHYKGYPAVLVHMDKIEDDELAEMIEEYWRKIAPKKLIAEFDGAPPAAKRKSAPKTSKMVPKKSLAKKEIAKKSARKKPATKKPTVKKSSAGKQR